MHLPAFLAILLIIIACCDASCSLSRALGSHMVLQRDTPSALWGFAAAGVRVNVTLRSLTYSTTTDAFGVWRVVLPATPATPVGSPGDALAIACSDGGTLALDDVLWGDVLLASGQSNMCFTVQQAFNGSAEVAGSVSYPRVRVMVAAHVSAAEPAQDLGGWLQPWAHASPSSIGGGNFSYTSALGYFVSRGLYDALGGDVPVGLVVSCVSGTSLASWSSPAALARCPSVPVPGGGKPSVLWNGMLHPFTIGPLSLTAMLFYQGENDADNWVWYSCGFPAFIADVRAALGRPALPWSFALLSAWVKSGTGNLDHLPRTRLAQLLALSAPATSMSAAYDLGDVSSPWPGHPRAKQPLAARMLAGLLAGVYGASLPATGPTYAASVRTTSPAGSSLAVRIDFEPSSLAGGLQLRPTPACPPGVPTNMCEAFALQTSDGVWRSAEAALSADGASLVLSVGGDLPPALAANASRAMFSNWPLAALYNGAGFPVVPWLEACQG